MISGITESVSGPVLYRRGVKAFTDYSPVTYSRARGIYRSVRWGRNLELFFLDARSFRDAKADANGVCDNPQTGAPDVAPTAPQANRSLFGAVLPATGLSQPVSQQCLDTIRDPNRDYLGDAQFNRFSKAIKKSKARFKVIINELPIHQYYVLPYDRWEGYEAERQQMLTFLTQQRQERDLPDHRRSRDARQRRPLPDAGGRRGARQRHLRLHGRSRGHRQLRARDRRGHGRRQRGAGQGRVLRARPAGRCGDALLGARQVQLRAGQGHDASGSRSPRRG